MQLKLTAVAAIAFALSACDDPSGPGGNGRGIQFLAGTGLADTIEAIPAQAIRVQVTDADGKPAAGVEIVFEAVTIGDDPFNPRPTMWVGSISGDFQPFLRGTTDPQGQISVRSRFGVVAGEGKVAVSVPALGYRDTARFTVRPGAAARLALAPKDSALYVGRSYTLRGNAEDRAGNPRPEPVTYTVRSGPVRLNGLQITGSSIGRGVLEGRAGNLADSTFVSVVPEGTLAVVRYSSVSPYAIYVVNLDGSGLKKIADRPGIDYHQSGPDWFPNGSMVVFTREVNYEPQLFTADLQGNVKRFVTGNHGLRSESWPQVSMDGAWVYFNGRSGSYNSELWRVRADGTNPERAGPFAPEFEVDGYASPSPDGSRLAYATSRTADVCCGTPGLFRVLTLTTRQIAAYNWIAVTPRWSPAGGEIAYLAAPQGGGRIDATSLDRHTGPIRVVSADGTNQRTITAGARQYVPVFDWSPDARYIVAASTADRLEVIDVRTGEALPLGFTAGFSKPAWKP